MPLLGLRGSGAATAFGFGKAGTAWQPAGAYDSLATVTVPSGGLASVTFAGIPTSGYQHLQIRSTANYTGGINYSGYFLRYNGDSTANYSDHNLYGSGGGVGAGGTANTTNIFVNWVPYSTYSNAFGAAIIDVLDYADVTKFKTTRTFGGIEINNPGVVGLTSGNWRNTTAITSITLTPSSNNFGQHSTFSLYGVK